MIDDTVLFLHLAGAFLLVGGTITAALLRWAAMQRERPSEIAALARAARGAVPIVVGGLLLVIGAGFWLADRIGFDLGTRWLVATYVLLGWVALAGAVAGRQDRHTRVLAERLAAQDDGPTVELSRRLRDPLNLALNGSMLAAIVAIVALMVWKPGL
jgi:uncharacterized membrane protein